MRKGAVVAIGGAGKRITFQIGGAYRRKVLFFNRAVVVLFSNPGALSMPH